MERRYAQDREQLSSTRPIALSATQTVYNRYKTGKLRRGLIFLQKAEILGWRLTERISRRSENPRVRRARLEYQKVRRAELADRELYRNHPDIDLDVIQNGFGFLTAMIPNVTSAKNEKIQQFVTELFELEMRSLPRPAADDPYCDSREVPHSYHHWIMKRVAEWITHTNSVEIAHRFYRPILDLGVDGRYWVEDFLQAWMTNALVMSKDLNGFADIWREMVEYDGTVHLAARPASLLESYRIPRSGSHGLAGRGQSDPRKSRI